ncbi:MAG: hypothetical protein IKO93_00215 [Lentisphaeria bacterium]|nr:hypothetical protein [Lentisphaeria bacterium]
MSPEELSRLSSTEFSAILAADPVLKNLRSRLVDRRDFIPATFDALLLSGGDRIGELPVLPMTAAKWAFLWAIESPFVTGKEKVSETDLDLFLFVLSCPDLRKLHVPLAQLPAEAGHYLQAAALPPEQVIREIQSVIGNAFSPLAMLPHSGSDPEEVFYDGAWLAWIASIAVKESGMPYDRVIHELPLSLLCQLYVAWRRRDGIDGDKIRRPQNGKTLDQIQARVDELGKEFLMSFKSQDSSCKSAERDSDLPCHSRQSDR